MKNDSLLQKAEAALDIATKNQIEMASRLTKAEEAEVERLNNLFPDDSCPLCGYSGTEPDFFQDRCVHCGSTVHYCCECVPEGRRCTKRVNASGDTLAGGGRESEQGRPVPKPEGQTSGAGASTAANPAAQSLSRRKATPKTARSNCSCGGYHDDGL